MSLAQKESYYEHQIQQAISTEAVLQIVGEIVDQVFDTENKKKEIDNRDGRVYYGLVTEAFIRYHQVHHPRPLPFPRDEFRNPFDLTITNMQLPAGRVLFAGGEVRRIGEPGPQWHQDLVAARSACARDEY